MIKLNDISIIIIIAFFLKIFWNDTLGKHKMYYII